MAGVMDSCKFLWCGAALIGLQLTVPFMSMILDHDITSRQLLVILPELYTDLSNYTRSLATMVPSLPSLERYFLDPFDKYKSPCTVLQFSRHWEIISGAVTRTSWTSIWRRYRNNSLKRQRGDQYMGSGIIQIVPTMSQGTWQKLYSISQKPHTPKVLKTTSVDWMDCWKFQLLKVSISQLMT